MNVFYESVRRSERWVAGAVVFRQWGRVFQAYLELSKIRIAVLATLSAATGFIVAGRGITWEVVCPVLGILFLAGCAGTLNQVQEQRIDARMKRTRHRPLPSGRVTRRGALVFAALAGLAGIFLLYEGGGWLTLGLGSAALLWYNGFYTYFKRVSAVAVVPGALIGAVPPLVGWVAAGRDIGEPAALSLAGFLFLWQIPHFWLLLLRFGEDYLRAGLPALTGRYSPERVARLTFVSIVVTGVAVMGLVGSGLIVGILTGLLLALLSVWLVWTSRALVDVQRASGASLDVFKRINIYALVVLLLLCVDAVVFHALGFWMIS